MAFQFSVNVRTARGEAIATAIGASPVLRFRTGAPPANTAAARTGTIVATLALPADPLDTANGVTTKTAGAWSDASADNAGVIGHFEIMSNDLSICHLQGTVTNTGGGGDLTVDNVNVNAGQPISVTGFQMTEGNA